MLNHKIALLLGFCFFLSEAIFGQRHYAITALSESPVIDGWINDSVWINCLISDRFTQTIPEPDKPSRYTSRVKMGYTREAIYIAAELVQPADLQLRQIAPRDGLGRCNADIFSVFLDTYNDKQNAFLFKVSSAGVQQDERLSGSAESGDIGWDAVWDAAVQSTDSSWFVEMEIPFSALRFSSDSQQIWGINFRRLVRSKNESSYWSPIDVQQQGFLQQGGVLTGLHELNPPVRLFLNPYLSSGLWRREQEGQSAENRWLRSGGLDVKYGINESFTLDMTLIPDFSQVISDNLIRNLSPFEQQLTENRPFFTEGTELFNKLGVFYSRRVGATPQGYERIKREYSDTSLFRIERNPNVTSLVNAFKISGRTKDNLGIGIFNALASPMFAEIREKQQGQYGPLLRIQTEPLTNYNLLVFDKPLQGQSYVNFTNTNKFVPSSGYIGNVSAVKWVQFDKKQMYRLILGIKNSVQGSDSFTVAQMADWSVGKVSGLFRLVYSGNYIAPRYSQRDMGILFDYNHTWHNISVSYNQNKPKTSFLQNYRLSWDNAMGMNVNPLAFKYFSSAFNYFLLFKNWWDLTFEIETRPLGTVDFYQLGAWQKRLQMYPFLYTGLNGSSDSRKKWFWSFGGGYGYSFEKGIDYTYFEQGLRKQLGNRWELSVRGEFTYDRTNLGYGYFDTQYGEPIVARRNVRQLNGEINAKLNISPNLNITGRIRHYNAQITNLSFHRTDYVGQWKPYAVSTVENLDENYNLQQVDIFLNWIFRPGSRLVVSYKQWLNDAYILNSEMGSTYFRNVFQVVQRPKSMEFNIRWIYFVDYNKTRKNFRPLIN